MARTIDLTNFCDERLKLSEIKDFPGAWNGLQIENDGEVKKILVEDGQPVEFGQTLVILK